MKAVLETWRPVPGYEGLYDVSDLGAVRSHYGGKVKYMKFKKSKSNYSFVCLYKNGKGKYFTVHRIVWEAFNGKIQSGMQIDHINTVRDDNRLVNLRCVTPRENQRNPITAERMQEARRRRVENPQWREKMREAAKKRSEEWRNNQREGVRRVCAKPILQINNSTGKVIKRWESAREAARELKLSPGNISACCRGERNVAGGFRWKFATGDD